jgi:hypothetical protein
MARANGPVTELSMMVVLGVVRLGDVTGEGLRSCLPFPTGTPSRSGLCTLKIVIVRSWLTNRLLQKGIEEGGSWIVVTGGRHDRRE